MLVSSAWFLMLAPILMALTSLVIYPLALTLIDRLRRGPVALPSDPSNHPTLSVVLPCRNEAAELPGAIEALSAALPTSGVQVIVVSDASTDGTDRIALAQPGVVLHRQEVRAGKTAAENAARELVTGDVVFFMDAASRPAPDAFRLMLDAFGDASVGVVSSCDVPGNGGRPRRDGPAMFLAYEMWLRELESRLGGIVGASGSLYAMRRELFVTLPENVTRDFATVLLARAHGLRAVSVPAQCAVRPAANARIEQQRRTRTMAQGMVTLITCRHVLHPMRDPGFTTKLFFHKVMRWLLIPSGIAGALGMAVLLAQGSSAALSSAAVVLTVPVIFLVIAGAGGPARAPGWLVPGVVAIVAGVGAWFRMLLGRTPAQWEPTRR